MFFFFLALVLGCHNNQCSSKHSAPVTDAAAGMSQRFPNSRSQVKFVSPVSMRIGWESSVGGGAKTFMPAQLTVPGRYNFDQGAIYRLKLTEVPTYAGDQFYPTLEIAPTTPRTSAYLTHNAIPIEFTDEDFDQFSAGNLVTKVI